MDKDAALIEALHCIQKVKVYVANWQPHTEEEKRLLDSLLVDLWSWVSRYGKEVKTLKEIQEKQEGKADA